MYNRIKEIRKALNINQKDFAKKLGLSQSTLAMIEVGKRNFSEKHIKIICAQFNVSEDWMHTGEGNMFVDNDKQKDFFSTFDKLSPVLQEYIIKTAKDLLKSQNELFDENVITRASDVD